MSVPNDTLAAALRQTGDALDRMRRLEAQEADATAALAAIAAALTAAQDDYATAYGALCDAQSAAEQANPALPARTRLA